MGNRTFLSVTAKRAEAAEAQYEDVAFETNNFLAPLWFSLVSREQYRTYRERLIAAWEAVRPRLDEAELEDLPEWEAFSAALDWPIPWGEASAQLRRSLPVALARYPALGPPMSEWLATLETHVRAHPSPVTIRLELAQYFDFLSDPYPYLEQIEQNLRLWWSPDESRYGQWDDSTTAYLLGGEHLPKRSEERNDETVAHKTAEEVRTIPPASSRKPSSKRKENFYLWLLAILSGALFLGTLLRTSSVWLSVLAFLLPSICIVLWELFIRPKKKPAALPKEKKAPAQAANKIAYYGGDSPITAQGIVAVGPDKSVTFTVLWPHILRARADLDNQVSLVLHPEFESLYPSPAIVNLDGEQPADLVASAANAIARLSRM